MLELSLHLYNTKEILKQEEEELCCEHILESNKALNYDGIRAEMKLNISESYNLLGKAIDSTKKNHLDLESPEVQMPTSVIDDMEWSIASY